MSDQPDPSIGNSTPEQPKTTPTAGGSTDETLQPKAAVFSEPKPPGAISHDWETLPSSDVKLPNPSNSAPASIRYFGDYEILQEIARGGMGVVYKARQSKLNRVVAVKMILSGELATEEAISRFFAEAQATATLDHPGIVPVYEIGQHQGQHYFSMAFIDGRSLADRVAKGPLPPKEAADVTRKIAEAIAYAHDKGVIHRDLKPANVLMDANGDPKVTDFGLARIQEQNSGMTRTGSVMGTPSYMPPEQAAGKTSEVGPLSDVYSLGAILYCLLTGRPPFQAATPLDTLLQVIEMEPVPVQSLNSGVPRDLETICHKCLQKESSKRYPSAQALVDDLVRWLHGEPIHARPVSRAERAIRWCIRHPAAALLMATATLLLVTLFVGGYSLVRQQQRNLALQQSSEKARVRELAESTLICDIGYLSSLLTSSSRRDSEFTAMLSDVVKNASTDVSEFRVLFLKYVIGEVTWDNLVQHLGRATPQETKALVDFLGESSTPLSTSNAWVELHKELKNRSSDSSSLQYASVLATLDAKSPSWVAISNDILNSLLASNSVHRSYWIDMLHPVRAHLAVRLADCFQDETLDSTSKISAAELLCIYGKENPDLILQAIPNVESKPFDILLNGMSDHREQLKAYLEKVVAQPSWKTWPEVKPDLAWKEIAQSLRESMKSFQGNIFSDFAYCQTMPISEAQEVDATLAQSGYSMTRFRPYLFQDKVLAAAIWMRGEESSRFVLDQTATEIEQLDKENREEGFVPVDVSGYLSRKAPSMFLDSFERYAAVWKKSINTNSSAEAGVYRIRVGLNDEELNQYWAGRGGSLHLIHGFRTFREPKPNLLSLLSPQNIFQPTEIAYSAIAGPELKILNHWNRDVTQIYDSRGLDGVVSLSITPSNSIPSTREMARLALDFLTRQSLEKDSRMQETLWQIYMGMEEYQKAIEIVSPIIDELEKKIQLQPNVLVSHYGYRAVAYAMLGKKAEAISDLDRIRNFTDQGLALWSIFPAVVYAILEDEKELAHWMKKMTRRVKNGDETDESIYTARFFNEACVQAFRSPRESNIGTKYDDRIKDILENVKLVGFGRQKSSCQISNEYLQMFLRDSSAFKEFARLNNLYQLFSWDSSTSPSFESQVVVGLRPDQCEDQFALLISRGYRMTCISCADVDGEIVAASVWHRPRSSEEEIDQRELARVQAAIGLYRIGSSELWPTLFRYGEDQRGNAFLVEAISREGIGPDLVIDLLTKQAKSPSEIRTLLLALGGYKSEELAVVPEEKVDSLLQKFYSHPDIGVRSATIWLSRQIGKTMPQAKVDQIANWGAEAQDDAERLTTWSIGPFGIDFAHVPAGSFVAGSNELRDPDFTGFQEDPQNVVIEKPFSIATTTVTKEVYDRFMEEMSSGMHPEIAVNIKPTPTGESYFSGFMNRVVLTGDSPVTAMPWTGACLFCNWYSKKAGIPEDQWHYIVDAATTEILDQRPDSFGFRLPHALEWEYAARAGTTTRRFFGHSNKLLGEYGWFVDNSQNRTWPVGLKKPNPFGLFDVYGNVWEWCDEKQKRGGGCFDGGAFWMRSSMPQGGGIHDGTGFRLARTLNLANSKVDQE